MTTVASSEQLEKTLLTKAPKLPENPNNQAVFPEGKSDAIRSLENATNPVRAKLETLRGLQNLSPTEARAKEMIDLERQRGRIARFALLQKGATPEQKEVLKEKDTLEKLKASDILLLKKKGVDLANLLLVPVGVDPTKSTNRDYIEKGEHKSFIVNFGESKDLKNAIGAGDILPTTVNTIMVNGKIGIRMDMPTKEYPDVKRPGYYDIVTKIYIPIYDGDNIEIMNLKKLTVEEEKISQIAMDERFKTARIHDMVQSMDLKKDNWKEDFTLLPEDQELITLAGQEYKNRAERKKRYEQLLGMGMTETMFRQYFGSTINKYASKYGIPPELVVALIRHESKFDFNALNPDSKAHGFGQHVPSQGSWEAGTNALGLNSLDKEDPFDQVIATIGYLVDTRNRMKGSPNPDWTDVVVAYHTGVSFDESHLARSMAINPGIVKFMGGEKTVEAYKRAAGKYYEVDQFAGQGYTEMAQNGDSIHSISWREFVGMPAEKSENDITLCSRTAQKNARLFGIALPRGDALNARSGYDSGDLLNNLSEVPANSNVLDVFMKSGSVYGHRCIAIKNKEDNQWYVLDPYISGEKPVLLSAYRSKDKIVNLVAHHASKVFAPKLLSA